ncbi:MAG: DUF58 domain-containing protein [Gammaproteobacteria bacterium]|jgi:uncharacterized protein (DUF58 family)|nr:DUF58 domain-containing protein [Gammaproteobacteria bacterium]
MALRPALDELLELRHQAHALGIASRHLVSSSFAGMYASVFRGQGLDFEEVREYREGDDIRSMDWKVTARTNEPHLKLYREERERSVLLCVDRGPRMQFGTRGTFKSVQAARAAALIGWAASRLNDRVGGILYGAQPQHFRPTKDRRALWRLLKALAEDPGDAAEAPGALTSALRRADRGTPTGSLVFVVGDFNLDAAAVERPLGQLMQRHSVVLLPIDDPAEHSLPAVGRVLFRGPDGALREVDTDDEAGRAAYAGAWRQRRTALQAMCVRLGILFAPIATDVDVHDALVRGLKHRPVARV